MADLGIAHLAAGQADIVARSVQKAMRPVPPQPVEGRRLGLADGVVGRIVAPTPAVHDHQHHWPPPLHFTNPWLYRRAGYRELQRKRQSVLTVTPRPRPAPPPSRAWRACA